MRGADSYSENLFSTIRLDDFVPANHTLRAIRGWMNETLARMDERASAMYEADVRGGRPSIAPEELMRAMLLQVLFSIRSEQQLVEQINYNLLFRWFVGLSIDDAMWNHSVFSKDRDRLIEREAVTELFNATHESRTDDESRLYRKSHAAPALPSYLGHVLSDNRHGLVANVRASQANGVAERDAAAQMLADVASKTKRKTVAADKAYDTKGFVQACREMNVTPHVAQNINRLGGSAIDARTTRHEGYAMSMRARKRIEQCFGWGKTVGPLAQVMLQGLDKVDQLLTLTMAAYNLTRLRALAELRPQAAQ